MKTCNPVLMFASLGLFAPGFAAVLPRNETVAWIEMGDVEVKKYDELLFPGAFAETNAFVSHFRPPPEDPNNEHLKSVDIYIKDRPQNVHTLMVHKVYIRPQIPRMNKMLEFNILADLQDDVPFGTQITTEWIGARQRLPLGPSPKPHRFLRWDFCGSTAPNLKCPMAKPGLVTIKFLAFLYEDMFKGYENDVTIEFVKPNGDVMESFGAKLWPTSP